jgi:uncharacterized protein (DUF1800 family)
VVQMARALTGWRDFVPPVVFDAVESSFANVRHDTGDKQLSYRFDNIIITNQGANEYATVVDIIFQKEEVARFICRKLYRWFVHSDITGEVEATVIEPMAQLLIAENYEIANPLRALLSSEHFYSEAVRGCMVSHPIEHFFKMAKTFNIVMPANILTAYRIHKNFHTLLTDSEMSIHNHPTVAGWKAFYQAPQFDKLWISSVSLLQRQEYSDQLLNGYMVAGTQVRIDVLAFAASLTNPQDPNQLITETANILFAQALTSEQLIALKEIILPGGLQDYNWTVDYEAYIAGDLSLEETIDNKLRTLIKTMVNMPEFHLV